jgi:predicted DCC family thiol-disulfide oxidoreductase YuxK
VVYLKICIKRWDSGVGPRNYLALSSVEQRVTKLFIFDGDCAFCSSSMRLLRKMTKGRITSSPYQFRNLDELGVSLDEAESAVQYIRGEVRLKGAEAIAYYLMDSKAVWSAAGWLMRAPVILSFAEIIYSVVAKNRHRLPGGTPECQLKPRS